LTENPYNSLRVGPDSGSTLWVSGCASLEPGARLAGLAADRRSLEASPGAGSWSPEPALPSRCSLHPSGGKDLRGQRARPAAGGVQPRAMSPAAPLGSHRLSESPERSSEPTTSASAAAGPAMAQSAERMRRPASTFPSLYSDSRLGRRPVAADAPALPPLASPPPAALPSEQRPTIWSGSGGLRTQSPQSPVAIAGRTPHWPQSSQSPVHGLNSASRPDDCGAGRLDVSPGSPKSFSRRLQKGRSPSGARADDLTRRAQPAPVRTGHCDEAQQWPAPRRGHVGR
jgi:hypothetical protein